MFVELVNIRRVKANTCEDFGIHRAAEVQVPADANAERAEVAGALRMRLEIIDDSAGVVIVGLERLVDLAPVAAIGAGGVVGESGSEGLEFVKDFRSGYDKAVT